MMSADLNQLMSKFATLRDDFEQFQRIPPLNSLTDEFNEITQKATTLSDTLAQVRQRGYAFLTDLAHKLNTNATQWQQIRPAAQQAAEREAKQLRDDADKLEAQVKQMEGLRGNPQALAQHLAHLETALGQLKSAHDTTLQHIRELYANVQHDFDQIGNQLHEIGWVLDQRDEASFAFNTGEALLIAARAEWKESGKGRQDPDGILYLTDQRLLFEQKETTGKTLGIFGGKKTQELEWTITLEQIEDVTAENKGLFGGKDLLHLTLASTAPLATATLEVKGQADCKFWAEQINAAVAKRVKDS